MKKITRDQKFSFLLAVIIFLLVSILKTVSAQSPDQDNFFTILELNSNTNNLPQDQELGFIRKQPVRINSMLLSKAETEIKKQRFSNLSLQIFPDLSFDIILTNATHPTPDTRLYEGKIQGNQYSSVTIAETNTTISAQISEGKRIYQLQFFNNEYYFVEVDQTVFPSELSPIIPPSRPQVFDTLPTEEFDSSPIVDIMVVYTDLARVNAGGTDAIENLINIAVSETNTGYANSGVNHRMNLVHTAEVAYSETNFNWSRTLDQLQNSTDGVLDQVHSMRDGVGADLVVMLVNNTSYCGIGYLMQVPSSVYANYAFSIVSRTCATGYYSFAHETGHNMGAAHDRANASLEGIYDYSYGYQAPDETFRTIMAYNCPSGCQRVNYWSNASINLYGQPMGVPTNESNAAENFRTLNNTASIVANFRKSIAVSSPTTLTTTDVKAESISLSFSDTSSNEDGFLVERSTNADVWSQINTLPANQTLFSDTNLICETTYYYQVRAFSGSYISEPSNQVQVKTSACVPPQPVTPQPLQVLYNSIYFRLSDLEEKTTYNIQQSPDGNNGWTTIMTINPENSEFVIDGLESNTTYYFQIQASNEYGTTYSDIVTVKTANAIFLPLSLR